MAIDCFIKRKITKFYQNLVIFYTLFIKIINLFQILFINNSYLVLYNGTKVYILFAKNNEKTYFFCEIVIWIDRKSKIKQHFLPR